MSLIADGLLIGTCLTAGLYCFILSRRLKSFARTDKGVGKQILQMNQSLEEIKMALKEAQGGARAASEALGREVAQSRKVSTQLMNLIANAEKVSSSLQASQDTGAIGESAPAAQASHSPKSVAAEPIALEAEDEIDPARLDELDDEEEISEDILAASVSSTSGAQQLGFVPDIDFDQEEDEDFEEAAEAPTATPVEAPTIPADAAPEAGIDADDATLPTVSAVATDNGLLKVERVAF